MTGYFPFPKVLYFSVSIFDICDSMTGDSFIFHGVIILIAVIRQLPYFTSNIFRQIIKMLEQDFSIIILVLILFSVGSSLPR